VTLLPRIVVTRAARDGRVALHRLPAAEARIDTVLIRRRDTFVSTALARFIEIARDRLGAAARSTPAHEKRGRRQLGSR
jgi:DNA-binding transcriptional LysR family regulator